MKRLFLTSQLLLATARWASAGTVAEWTFESPGNHILVSGPSISGLLAEAGSGTASGLHASSSTIFRNGTGNGSLNSLRANYFQTGDYWQFQTSTLGLGQLHFSLDMASAGITNCELAYSVDGSSFTTFDPHISISIATLWSPTTRVPTYNRAFDLSSITELNNDPNVYLRLIANAGAGPVSENSWMLDNVVISATTIPEPAQLLPLAGTALLAFRRLGRRLPNLNKP